MEKNNNKTKEQDNTEQYYQEIAQIDFDEACMQAGIPIKEINFYEFELE